MKTVVLASEAACEDVAECAGEEPEAAAAFFSLASRSIFFIHSACFRCSSNSFRRAASSSSSSASALSSSPSLRDGIDESNPSSPSRSPSSSMAASRDSIALILDAAPASLVFEARSPRRKKSEASACSAELPSSASGKNRELPIELPIWADLPADASGAEVEGLTAAPQPSGPGWGRGSLGFDAAGVGRPGALVADPGALAGEASRRSRPSRSLSALAVDGGGAPEGAPHTFFD